MFPRFRTGVREPFIFKRRISLYLCTLNFLVCIDVGMLWGMQQQEVVILYGDMSIRPFEYVRKTPNFDQANWPECGSATRVSSQSSVLLDQLPSIRTQHTAYISELSRVNNEVTCRAARLSFLL